MSYNFSVLVGYYPAKVYTKSERFSATGEYFIEGRSGSEYSLRFTNESNQRVLAIFSVDGLDTVEGKAASKNSRGYVVGPWETIIVPGWTINENKVAKFQFQPQGTSNQTYVEALKADGIDVDTGNQGVIGVMVVKEKVYPKYYGGYIKPMWKPFDTNPAWSASPSSVPMSYNASFSVGSSSVKSSMTPTMDSAIPSGATLNSFELGSASLGTAFGSDETFNTRTVTFERDLDAVIWTKVYTYDTLTNLRRMGVNVDEPKTAFTKAFPGGGIGCHVPSNRG